MPVGVVRTRADELAWEQAKELARREYPDATGSDFYRIVMGIYKRMTHYQPKGSQRRRSPISPF
jgi:hypothetical protein